MSVTELTRDLVAIPSHGDETDVGEYIEEWLRRETTADVRRDDVGNVLAVSDGFDSEPPDLALVGHHDVVPPEESQVDGTENLVERRGGRLYGRGTADMKGAVAAAMLAFRDADPAGSLAFASFVGEEVGGIGAQHAIENGFVPTHAIVGEGSTNYSGPGVTDVVVAHRGRRGSTITAQGVASHASVPETGENAIYRACDVVDELRSLTVPSVEVAGELMSGSLVVTEIEGGTATNMVPSRCSISIDERTVPGGYAPLETLTESDDLAWSIDQDVPPMACDDEEFADAVLESARRIQDGMPQRVTKPHATDAGWLADAGTECIVCGPSEPGEAHTKDESVSIEVLERCYRLYLDVAQTWP